MLDYLHETGLDRNTLIAKEQQEILNRTLKLAIEDPSNVTGYGGLYIVADATRAGKVLSWTADGTKVEATFDAATLAAEPSSPTIATMRR